MLKAIDGWRRGVAEGIKRIFGVEMSPGEVPITFPPKPELGDVATPVAFSLAKKLKRAPVEIAGELSKIKLEGIEKIEVAGGYLNLFVDRSLLIYRFLEGGFISEAGGGKVIVEHTNINPNKAAHVGHLRNAVLGDTLARCLRYLNRETEVQNYIDDTGVQVADVVVGFQKILEFDLEGVLNLIAFYKTCRGLPSNLISRRIVTENPRSTRELPGGEREISSGKAIKGSAVLTVEIPGTKGHSYTISGKSEAILEAVAEIISRSRLRFDWFCWELYAKVAPWYEESEENRKARFETLKLMEEGNNETAELATLIAEEMVRCHLRTMNRLGIYYDLITRESNILKSGFWTACFEKLKAAGAIHHVPPDSEDKNHGCWVMALSESDDFRGMSDADKVIVRSTGTVTYIGKDIAYQLWKFGLLGRDFHYRKFDPDIDGYPPERFPWQTDSDKFDEGSPSFGAGEAVYNVIDVRQSYLQKIVKEGLRQMGYEKQSECSIHVAYEMVALASRFVREEIDKGAKLDLSEEDLKKNYVEMSGRKGLGFKADALLDRLVDRAASEIEKREPELDGKELLDRARDLAVGALRYYMLKYGKNQVVAFDMEQALAFEGETGPYLQYACVRAEQILAKAEERGVEVPNLRDEKVTCRVSGNLDEEGWALLSLLARTPVVVNSAVASLDLNLVAKHLHDAAQAFHAYYHACPVLSEPDAEKREARLFTVALFARTLRGSLDSLLGIPVPDRM